MRVERGDVLLVRTGHLSVFKVDGDRVGYMRMMPGLGIACAAWLHAREVAAVATDTNVGRGDPVRGSRSCRCRCTCSACATWASRSARCSTSTRWPTTAPRDGVWEFLFSAPPLRVTGGVGSPLNPLAIK